MTITELIAVLETLPPDRQVILSTDAEGNGYSRLSRENIDATDDRRIVLYPDHGLTQDVDELDREPAV